MSSHRRTPNKQQNFDLCIAVSVSISIIIIIIIINLFLEKTQYVVIYTTTKTTSVCEAVSATG